MNNDTVTLREIADDLGVGIRTVYRLVRRGIVPVRRRIGRNIVYTRHEARQIAAWWKIRQVCELDER